MSEHQGSNWAEVKERGNAWAMAFLFWLYRWTGPVVIYPVICVVVLYFFATRAATRRHSRQYLRRALGREPTLWQVWRHHLAFARALRDRLGAWMGRIERRDVSFSGHQTLVELQQSRRGGVLLGAHFGNLEMCRAVVENDGSLQLNVILHNANTEKFNGLMRRANRDSQVRLIQVSEVTPATAMMLKEKLDRGEFLILLADRLPPANPGRYLTGSFLGGQVPFPAGPFWLALMLEAPVYFLAGFETPEGYRAELEPLHSGEKVPRREREAACRQLLARYSEQLEHCCRRYPYQWFNFYDYFGDDAPAGEPTGATHNNE